MVLERTYNSLRHHEKTKGQDQECLREAAEEDRHSNHDIHSVVVIVDTNPSMGKELGSANYQCDPGTAEISCNDNFDFLGTTPFDLAKGIVRELIWENRSVTNQQTIRMAGLVSTDSYHRTIWKTNRSDDGMYGDQEHCSTSNQSLLEALNLLTISKARGDFVDGIVTAAELLYNVTTVEELGFGHKRTVVLLTDGRHKVLQEGAGQKSPQNPVQSKDSLEELLLAMNRLRVADCKLFVVGLGFPETSCRDEHDGDSDSNQDDEDESDCEDDDEEHWPEVQRSNAQFLQDLVDKLGGRLLVVNPSTISACEKNNDPYGVRGVLNALCAPNKTTSSTHDNCNRKKVEKVDVIDLTKPRATNTTPSVVGSTDCGNESFMASSLQPSLGDRVIWDGTDNVTWEEWIEIIRPSLFSGNEAEAFSSLSNRPQKRNHQEQLPYCTWIQINSPEYHRDGSHLPFPSDISRYESWLKKFEEKECTEQECFAALLGLAKSDECSIGKWLVFCSPSNADQVWSIIARATAERRLGCSSKVSPTGHLRQQDTLRTNSQAGAVICVYTPDSTNQLEIKRIFRVLRQILPSGCRIGGFKPDLFTYLDIYSGNSWGLRPVLYTAKQALVW